MATVQVGVGEGNRSSRLRGGQQTPPAHLPKTSHDANARVGRTRRGQERRHGWDAVRTPKHVRRNRGWEARQERLLRTCAAPETRRDRPGCSATREADMERKCRPQWCYPCSSRRHALLAAMDARPSPRKRSTQTGTLRSSASCSSAPLGLSSEAFREEARRAPAAAARKLLG